MRSTADPQGDLVGLLKNGETVTVLGEVVGSDGKAWSKTRGTVTSAGQSLQAEGFVRSDYLKK
jgi:hypothetical protein